MAFKLFVARGKGLRDKFLLQDGEVIYCGAGLPACIPLWKNLSHMDAGISRQNPKGGRPGGLHHKKNQCCHLKRREPQDKGICKKSGPLSASFQCAI